MFKFSYQPEIRFRDIDVLGHVNNAVYFSYLEQTRIAYLRHLGLRDQKPSTILVANQIDYLRPVLLGDKLEIKMACTSIGNKSLVFIYEIYANHGLAAKAKSTHVWFDAEQNKTSPVPEQAIAALERFEGQKLKNR
ncbi:MAG: acyl-CoA thioesterase [Deinococcales bacterium]